MKTHNLKKHPTEVPHPCAVCDFTFEPNINIQDHVLLHHMKDTTLDKKPNKNKEDPVILQCKVCPFRTKHHMKDLTLDKKPNEHKEDPVILQCEVCPFKTKHHIKDTTLAKKPNENKEDPVILQCEVCPFKRKHHMKDTMENLIETNHHGSQA